MKFEMPEWLKLIELPAYVKTGILGVLAALHWVTENMPVIVSWGTGVYMALQILIAIKKLRAKPSGE